MSLPLILSLVVVSIMAGGAVTILGYYAPFMLLSSVLMSIGAGLLSTFKKDTGHSMWIGYQFLFGAGVGFGMQQPLMAVQTALPLVDVPVGTATMMFAQTLGGALFISVGQNVFQNQLIKNLAQQIPELPAIQGLVATTGATQLKSAITSKFPGLLDRVLIAYDAAIAQTFYVSVAMGALSILGAVVVEWKSVKRDTKKKGDAATAVATPAV